MGILLLILYFAHICSNAYFAFYKLHLQCCIFCAFQFNSRPKVKTKWKICHGAIDFSIYEDVSLVGLDSMTKHVLTTMLFFLPYNKVSWTSMEVLFAENTNTVYQITHSTGLQPPWKREERWKEKQRDCWGYIGNPRRCKAPPEKSFQWLSFRNYYLSWCRGGVWGGVAEHGNRSVDAVGKVVVHHPVVLHHVGHVALPCRVVRRLALVRRLEHHPLAATFGDLQDSPTRRWSVGDGESNLECKNFLCFLFWNLCEATLPKQTSSW